MFVILWEFQVKHGFQDDFIRAYSADGDWARLFRQSTAHHGTRLARDADREGWYFTIDFWDSRNAYDAFRDEHAADYAELDCRFDSMTLVENCIGAFDTETPH